MAEKKPTLAKVEDYPERPYKDAHNKKADDPREQVDQIEDYHKKHPTLKTDGPAHDPEVQTELAQKAVDKQVAAQEQPQGDPK